MPRFKVSATVADGPTNSDLTVDGADIIIDNLAGKGILTSDKDPIPYSYKAVGPAGLSADLTIVLKLLPKGTSINFQKSYTIPNDGLLSDDNGQIPVKKEGDSK